MNLPKDTAARHWTNHVKSKMFFYRLSESRILRAMRTPDRQQEGIAPKTVAIMQRNDTPKRKEEIWVLTQNVKRETWNVEPKIIIISAWRYPGISKPGVNIPMPEGLLDEILDAMRV